MDVEDRGERIVVTMQRDEFFLVSSLMMEALETADVRDFQTRVGATIEQVRLLIASLPELPMNPPQQA